MWRVNVCQKCRLQENEVAAVEPPPVVLYSPDSNTDTSQPESPVQPDPHPPIHHKPQDPYSQQPTDPDPHNHPDPRYPAPTDPRYPSYTERINRPDGRYSGHTTQERPTYPYHRYPVTTPRRPPVPETPVHRHTSGPGVRCSCFCPMFQRTGNWWRWIVPTASPDCPERPSDRRYAGDPWCWLPVLHTSSGHRDERNVPCLPLIQTPGSPQHCR